MNLPKIEFRVGRTARLLLGVFATALFVYLISRELEWGSVVESVSAARWEWLVASPIFLMIGVYFRILRWWQLLRTQAKSLTLKACVWPYLLGLWLNIIIPFRAGDFVRSFGFREQLMTPGARSLGFLVVERILDLVAVLTVFFIGLIGLSNFDVIPEKFANFAIGLTVVSVAALLCLLYANKPISYFVHRLLTMPVVRRYKISNKFRSWSDHFFDGVSSLRGPWILSNVIILTTVIWTLEGTTYFMVAIAVGTAEPPLASWFAFSLATLATAIPSTPGFVGTFDYFAALGLSAFGIEWNKATVFAVITHITIVLPFAAMMLVYGCFKMAGKLPVGAKAPLEKSEPEANVVPDRTD